ncbi:MAG: proprotein convertase P-domain-containing protein [Lewinellaceae bacterium]|nr:proprotein convertase P-domain-containing protein [Saprospiraceae bacterium]MCB9338949.1 proprotein convertase P-domain-containing protein [Lewinellaceae bacterium]
MCPASPNYNLSLNASGQGTLNANSFIPLVSSSYSQCLPPVGTLQIWEDATALTPYPTSLPGANFNQCDINLSPFTVYVTLNDPGPGVQSPTCMFIVKIVDNVLPVITPPVAANPYSTDPGPSCAAVLSFTATYTDNPSCAPNPVLSHTLSGATTGGPFPGLTANHAFNVGTTTITWSVDDDGAGPHPPSTATTTVIVSDNQPPTYLSVISDATLYANGGPAPGCTADRMWTHPVVSDNCGIVTYTITYTGATPGGPFNVVGGTNITKTFNLGTTTCTYRVDDDGAGPHPPVLQTFTVTVEDNTPPVFAAAPTIVSAGTVTCQATISAPTLTRTATDNCDASVAISFTVTTISGGPAPFASGNNGNANGTYPVGVYEIKYTAEDNEMNTATHTVTLTVTDNIDPVAVCKNITVGLDSLGGVWVHGIDLDNGSTDNCGVTSWQIRNNPPGSGPWFDSLFYNCSNIGFNNVQFRVRDAGGNNSNPPVCNATITVVDDMPPLANCKDITVDLNMPGPSPNFTSVEVFATQINDASTDNCTNPLTKFRIKKGHNNNGAFPDASVIFDCSELGPQPVTLRVRDDASPVNENFCFATVTVRDVTPPVPVCNPVVLSLDAVTGTLDLLDPNPAPAATATYTNNTPAAITDFNTTTSTLNVPTSTLTGDVNVNINITHTWMGDLTVTLTSPKGTTVTLFDGLCGSDNDMAATFDDEAATPVVCSPTPPPAVTGTFQPEELLSAFDGENMAGVWTLSITDDTGGDVGTLTSWSLTLTDSYLTLLGAGSTDNCCVQWTSNLLSFDCDDIDANLLNGTPPFDPFTYTLTVFDSDADGQSETATCQSTILIQDVTPPTPVCPATPVDVYLDALGNASVAGSLVGAASTDNCTISVFEMRKVFINPAGFGPWSGSLSYDCNDVGLNTVRLRVQDKSGNPNPIGTGTLCPNAINIIDNIAPVAICNSVSVALGSNGMVTVPALSVSLGSTDNCYSVLFPSCPITREISTDGGITYGPNAVFNCSNIPGPNVVHVRVTDCHNNSSICTTNVTIQDNEVPTLTCPPMITVECTSPNPALQNLDPSVTGNVVIAPLVPGPGDGLANDNCVVTVSYMDGAPVIVPGCVGNIKYTVARTWKAEDGQGNMNTCVQTIKVQDTTKPTFTAPSDVMLECPVSYQVANSVCTTFVNGTDVIISDVGTPTITSTIPINLPVNGKISDVNVRVEISHNFVGDLEAELIYLPPGVPYSYPPPLGSTSIRLFGEPSAPEYPSVVDLCDAGIVSPTTKDIDLVFDDNGLLHSAIPCPPVDETNVYQPKQALSAFIGKHINGNWVLRIHDDFATIDGGGALTSWNLDICYNPQAEDLTASGDVTNELDNCDTPQATFKDYEAFKDFANNTKNTQPSSTTYNFAHGTWMSTVNPVPPGLPALPLVVNNTIASLTMRSHITGVGPYTNEYKYVSIPKNGWVMFDWSKTGDIGGDQFAYFVNGSETTTTTTTGRAVVRVLMGDMFGFRQKSDGDVDQTTTTITNFVYIDENICPVPAFTCPREFCVARIWDLQDDCGNEAASQVQIIRTKDTTKPVVDVANFPTIRNVVAPAGICTPFVSLNIASFISDGGCSDPADLSVTNTAFSLYGIGDGLANASGNYGPGVYNFSFTITDECGNSTVYPINLTVEDNEDPNVNCFNYTAQLNNNGTTTVFIANINNNSLDNCPGLTLSLAPPPAIVNSLVFTTANIGQNVVTLYGTDASNNTESCNSIVTVTGGIIFDAGDASGPANGMALIPVTVQSFDDITGFSFNMNIANASVATVIGVQDIHPALAGLVSNVTPPTGVSVSWIDNTFPIGLDLPNGTVIFNLKVMLGASVGSTTSVTVTNTVTTQLVGGGPATAIVPSLGLSGTVNIVNPGTTFAISGTLKTEALCGSDPIHLVDVNMTGSSNSTVNNAMGTYSFPGVPSGSNVVITPAKNVNWMNGVTAFDKQCVQQYITFGQGSMMPPCPPSFTPYQIIAADVNKDNVVNIFDGTLIQQLALGFITSVPSNTSWRFVPEATVLPAFPLPVPAESIPYNNLGANHTDANFIGVKVGDVVFCDADPVNMFGGVEDNRNASLKFSIDDQAITAGEDVMVTLKASDFNEMSVYQMTLNFNQQVLEFVEAIPGSLVNLSQSNFNALKANEGMIATNWYNLSPISLDNGADVFTLKFKALSDASTLSDLLHVSSDYIIIQAVKVDGEVKGIDLEFEGFTAAGETMKDRFALYQNRPNPFGYKTAIGFNLPQSTNAKLSIMDASGRVLKVFENTYTAGYHQIFVDRKDLPATGVLFYRLETPANTAVKKMILLD